MLLGNHIQLSRKGEVNSGVYNKARSVEVYVQRCSPTPRGIVVLVFTRSVGEKLKKQLFVNKKRHLVGTLFTI